MIEVPEGLDLSEYIDHLTKMQKYTAYPVRPHTPKKLTTSTELENFAKELRNWEVVCEEVKQANESFQQHNHDIDFKIEARIWSESGLTYLNVSESKKGKIWNKAWQDGHSCGYYEVYLGLCDLVDLFKEDDNE